MKQLSYAQICQLFAECHSPSEASDTHAMQWAKKMEWMLGPDDCKGFIIRGDGMYLLGDNLTWCGSPSLAKLFTWGETAVRISNNPKLEAIRVGNDNTAKDYKGIVVTLFGKDITPVRRDKDG
jgi:hypothetical protein